MKRARLAINAVMALAILGVIAAVALPGYADHSPRASVSAALAVIGNGRAALDASCTAGTFASKQKLNDIDLSESDPKAYILRAELTRIAPDTVRLKTALTDISGRPFFGLFPWKVISKGSILDFEYQCSADRKFFVRLAASTVDQKYLPPSLRGP